MFTKIPHPKTLDSILSQFAELETELSNFIWDAMDEEKEIQAQIDALMVAREVKQSEIQKAEKTRVNLKELTGG